MATQQALQLTLFEMPDKGSDKGKMNLVALWDLAPRFVNRVDRKDGSVHLSVIKRDFTFNGELYRIVITPARITDAQGVERDMLPGEREQLVEDVIRKYAAKQIILGDQEEVQTPFSTYGIWNELARHNHTFSKAEIREALFVLNMSNIQIIRLTADGKQKAVVSAPAFPVLFLRDENDTAYVQLNPLIAHSIKTLAFEQVNYEWMMQIKNPLPRWVFKSISLMMAELDGPQRSMELKASEIIGSFGQARTRWREMLSEVEKAVVKLKEAGVIADFVKTDIKEGRKKVDAVFAVQFSRSFLDDRVQARRRGEFVRQEALRKTGKKAPNKFHPITDAEKAEIQFRQNALIEDSPAVAN